jgi:hypothetical protein
MCLARIRAWWAAKKLMYKQAAELGYQVGYNKAKEVDEKYRLTNKETTKILKK